MTYPLAGIIDRFEGETAVIRFSDGQELRVARSALPENLGQGATVTFSIAGDPGDEAARTALAKSMLNELLGGRPSRPNQPTPPQ